METNNEKGILYMVATPIGNLEDMTYRAVRILKEVDFIYAEDTRNTGILLARYEIKNKMRSFHAHSKREQMNGMLEILQKGESIAIVTDAGTPGISDPGNGLVAFVREHDREVQIVPIVGASALSALLSVAGIPVPPVVFMGFAPTKKGRMTFLDRVCASEFPVVLYESSHRIEKLMVSLSERQEGLQVLLGRELTKKFETVIGGTPAQMIEYLQVKPTNKKGEFVVLVSGQSKK
jgi:16S rRNA (cytidine1402-2'-O)-methyltransferase